MKTIKIIFKYLNLLCMLSCLGLVISCNNRKVKFSVVEEEAIIEKQEKNGESRQEQLDVFSASKIDFTSPTNSVTGKKKTVLDIIFVVDNSGSMNNNQKELSIHFQTLYKDIQQNEIDFQLAIVPTDAYRSSSSDFYAAPGNDRILTQNTLDLERQFQENVMVGIGGHSDERGISSLITVLKNNPSFLRTHAHLSIVVLSDEDEMESGMERRDKGTYVPLYLNELKKLKGSDDFSVTAIVDKTPLHQGNPSKRYGLLYIEMARQTQDEAYEITSEFKHIMREYSESIVQKIEIKKDPHYFRLTAERDLLHDLEVFVAGEQKTEGTDYFYSETENGIYFADSSLPQEGSEIEVWYYPLQNNQF